VKQAGAKPKPAFDWSQIDALRDNFTSDVPAPAGSFTINAYASAYKLLYRTAVNQLNAMLRRGELRTGRFVGRDAAGNTRLLRMYWRAS